jgi:membrane peptidoglycan carboxypeptidase
MSDRQPNDHYPDASSAPKKGAPLWRKPDAQPPRPRGEWHVPGSEEKAAAAPFVPLEGIERTPEIKGGWHLPDSEQITIPPSIILPGGGEDTPTRAAEEEAIPPVLPHNDDDGAQAADAGQAVTEVLPFDDGAPSAAAEPAEAAPQAHNDDARAEDVSAPPDLEADEEDERLGISELVALQSLADAPSAPAAPQPSEGAPLDPAEYARRELERLQARSAGAVGTSEEDPAAFAARQLEQMRSRGIDVTAATAPMDETGIGASTSGLPPAPAALTPAEQELARRYRQSEARARTLKSQFNAGLISRETLEAELKKLMILEDGRVWWMIGVQSDQWYKYENNQWIPATPRVLEREAQQSAADSSRAVGGSLPLIGSAERPASAPSIPTSGQFSQPLPRSVPVRDPDLTQVAAGGAFLSDPDATVPLDPDRTVRGSGAEPTIVNPAVTDAGAIPAPAEASAGVDAAPSESLYKRALEERRASTLRGALIAAALIVGGILLLGACGIIGLVVTYNNIAEPWRGAVAALANYQPQFRTARILAADNSLIAELNSASGGARTTVRLSEIAPEVLHAVVSIENERFFSDPGWDPIAIGRAFIDNLLSGQIVSGASTITQQIARRLIMQDNTVSAERKLQEIVIAAEIARTYDKEFILELYLNEVSFGNQSNGIQAAAEFYFNTNASDLNLPQAALLAGLIQQPTTYDPVTNRQAAFQRMNVVLNRMAEVGCLPLPYQNQPFCVTREQINSPTVAVQKANVESANYRPRQFARRYPHFVDYIQAVVERAFGADEMFRRGFTIRTTLVPRIQDTAQQALEAQLRSMVNTGVNNGAVLVTNPVDGAILAMVGSVNYFDDDIDGQVNDVFTWQSPGSALKPVLYTAALEGFTNPDGSRSWYTPATVLWDVPTTFNTQPPYSPVNFDRSFRGPVSLRSALANSYNVPAVKTLFFIGIDRFRETAERMGIDFLPEAQFGLPTALGATDVRLFDLVEAYGTLANNGRRAQPYAILSITDANGQPVPLPTPRPEPVQVVQPGIAYLMQNILADNDARTPAFGANSGMFIPEFPGMVAAKTGTSEGSRDLWTVGFTRNTVVGVWLGRNDNNPTINASSVAAIPVWNQTMRAALNGRPPEPFQPPPGIVTLPICTLTGARYEAGVSQGCGSIRNELFIDSQLPPPADQSYLVSVAVDTWTGLRANANCPDESAGADLRQHPRSVRD